MEHLIQSLDAQHLLNDRVSDCCKAQLTPIHLKEDFMKYQVVCNKCLQYCAAVEKSRKIINHVRQHSL